MSVLDTLIVYCSSEFVLPSNVFELSGIKRQPVMISIAFVGQDVEQGLARMACVCAVMSGAQLGTREGGGWIICRLLHLHVWCPD